MQDACAPAQLQIFRYTSTLIRGNIICWGCEVLSQHFSVIRRKQIFVRPVVSFFAAKMFGQAKGGKKHSRLTDKGRNKIINEANNRVGKLC